jgi:hypothetical protein
MLACNDQLVDSQKILAFPISEFGVCLCSFLVHPRLCTKNADCLKSQESAPKVGRFYNSKNLSSLKVLCHNLCVIVQAVHELGIDPVFEKAQPPLPQERCN